MSTPAYVEKKLITTPTIMLAIGVACAVCGLRPALETYQQQRAEHVQAQAAQEINAKRIALDKSHIKQLQETALERVKNYCVVAHDLTTGLPAESTSQGTPFHNLNGQPVSDRTPICARDGSTGIVLYLDGEPVVSNIARVHRDDMAEYTRYYNTYRKASDDSSKG